MACSLRQEKMLAHPENRVIGFVLLPIRPAELGKTTNTTFTTSNNLRAVARIAILLQGKQQNTTLRQDITPGEISRKCVQGEALFIVVSIAASLMSAWASKRRCPREALYLVVKVVQVVFHVSTLHHSIFRKNLVSTRGPACLGLDHAPRGSRFPFRDPSLRGGFFYATVSFLP